MPGRCGSTMCWGCSGCGGSRRATGRPTAPTSPTTTRRCSASSPWRRSARARSWAARTSGPSSRWFEYDAEGRPLRAEDYRTLCMASVNTHDLPPTAGYLAGDHVSLRHELGLLERGLDEELAADAAGRQQVLDLLRAEGLLA